MRRVAALLGLALGLTGPLKAQGVGISAGYLFRGDGWGDYRLSLAPAFELGAASLDFHGAYLAGPGSVRARLYGIGAEASLFRGGRPGLYLLGSLDGGYATARLGEGGAPRSRGWWGWSGGLGYELRPAGFLSVGVEGRWREVSWPTAGGGIELGFRLGLGGARPAAPLPGTPGRPGSPAGQPRWWSYGGTDPVGERPGAPVPLATAANGPAGDADAVAGSVVATAMDALGTRYQYGGTGQAGDGFDCSGLIQYAFGEHGISLPRTSQEQARAGKAVPRKLEALEPGDLLTFARSGTRVTHVGLYLGDGRFIHSATGGVQVSRLSPDDPYGRWWWKRWVGVRRLIQQ